MKKVVNQYDAELLSNYNRYTRELKWLKAKVAEYKKEVTKRGF